MSDQNKQELDLATIRERLDTLKSVYLELYARGGDPGSANATMLMDASALLAAIDRVLAVNLLYPYDRVVRAAIVGGGK